MREAAEIPNGDLPTTPVSRRPLPVVSTRHQEAVAVEQASITLDALTTTSEWLTSIENVACQIHQRPELASLVVGMLRIAKRDAEWAIAVATHIPYGRRWSLSGALHKFTGWINATTDFVSSFVQVRGRPRPLDPDVQRVLYQIACTCIGFSYRTSACQGIAVRVNFTEEAVSVCVVDDGVALRPAADEQYPKLQLMLAEVGGWLAVDATSRGVFVTATVPAERAY